MTTNKQDELLASTLNSTLHPETQETFDNLVNGLACHYERLGKGITDSHAADKYTLEYVYTQLRRLIKQHREAYALEENKNGFFAACGVCGVEDLEKVEQYYQMYRAKLREKVGRDE